MPGCSWRAIACAVGRRQLVPLGEQHRVPRLRRPGRGRHRERRVVSRTTITTFCDGSPGDVGREAVDRRRELERVLPGDATSRAGRPGARASPTSSACAPPASRRAGRLRACRAPRGGVRDVVAVGRAGPARAAAAPSARRPRCRRASRPRRRASRPRGRVPRSTPGIDRARRRRRHPRPGPRRPPGSCSWSRAPGNPSTVCFAVSSLSRTSTGLVVVRRSRRRRAPATARAPRRAPASRRIGARRRPSEAATIAAAAGLAAPRASRSAGSAAAAEGVQCTLVDWSVNRRTACPATDAARGGRRLWSSAAWIFASATRPWSGRSTAASSRVR